MQLRAYSSTSSDDVTPYITYVYGLEILARQIRQANCQPFRRHRMMSLNAVSMMSLSAVDPWDERGYRTDNGVKIPAMTGIFLCTI